MTDIAEVLSVIDVGDGWALTYEDGRVSFQPYDEFPQPDLSPRPIASPPTKAKRGA
jgi:hypothetical protein